MSMNLNLQEIDFSEFPLRLKDLILETDSTATQISLNLCLGNSTINRYIEGKSFPTTEILVKLCDYFNCSCDYLLGLKDESPVRQFKSCPPFDEQFKFLCKKYSISRYELGKTANISESLMRYWWRGKYIPSIPNVIKIAQFLNCTVDFVLGREN